MLHSMAIAAVNRRLRRGWLTNTFAFFALAGTASGQEIDIGMPNVMMDSLLRSEAVQQTLNASPDQIARGLRLVSITQRKQGEVYEATSHLSGDEKTKKQDARLEPLQLTWEEELGKVLPPDQIRRFRQLELQARGYFALDDRVMRKAMDLSEDQVLEVSKAIAAFQRMMHEDPEGKRLDAIRRKSLERLELALTTAQKSRWNELLGAPFDFKKL